MNDDAKRVIFGIVCFLVVLIPSLVMFGVSFDTVEVHEIGLVYNNNFKSLSFSPVYRPGRYFLGLGQHFVIFPTDVQRFDFGGDGFTEGQDVNTALRAWSREGQLVILELTVLWRIEPSEIRELYLKYRTDYPDALQRIVIRTVKEESIRFNADDFFLERKNISIAFRDAVRNRLRPEHVILDKCILRGVDLPDRFEAKIVSKIVQAQQVRTAVNLRTTAILRGEVEVITGGGRAEVRRIIANAEASEFATIEAARSQEFELLLRQEADSYQQLQSALGLNDTTLLQYRWAQISQAAQVTTTRAPGARRFIVGFDSPVISVRT